MLVSLLTAALISQASASAQGQGSGGGIGSTNMNIEYRTRLYCLPKLAITVVGTDVTAGVNSVIMTSGSMSGLYRFAQTSSIAVPPFPGKVSIVYKDDGGQTLTCSTFAISGKDQFGISRSETLTTVSETAVQTANVYRSVSSLSGTCTSGDNSGDVVYAYMGIEGVGIPLKIKGTSGIAMLNWDDGGVTRSLRPGATDTARTFDNAGSGNRIDLTHNAINLSSTLDGTNSIADGDGVCLQIIAPNGI